MIKANNSALLEMERMRSSALFQYHHPLSKYITGYNIVLSNISSWNAHIEDLLSDPIYINKCSLLCFTETNLQEERTAVQINEWKDNWEVIHFPSEHGLAICYKKEEMKLNCHLPIVSNIEAIACTFTYKYNIPLTLLLVYRKPGPLLDFINQLTHQVSYLPKDGGLIVLGDFNLDQRDPVNVNRFSTFLQEFSLSQYVQFTTHRLGGILDLVFSNSSVTSADAVPTPFSDHFVVCANICSQ